MTEERIELELAYLPAFTDAVEDSLMKPGTIEKELNNFQEEEERTGLTDDFKAKALPKLFKYKSWLERVQRVTPGFQQPLVARSLLRTNKLLLKLRTSDKATQTTDI